MKKMIEIGRSGGKPVRFDLELLLRSRLLIQANSGGGKSWAIRKLAEELFGSVQVIIIDREGEFASLRDKYGYMLVGEGGDAPADIRSARLLAEKLLEFRVSAICDLYEAFRTSTINRLAWVRAFLSGLVDAPKHLWHDVVVIVDEAHAFCPQENPKAASMHDREIISGCKEQMVALATVGRKRGQCAVWATQRLAKLDKDASAELFNRMVGMTMEDQDVDRAIDLMSVSRENRHEFRKSLRELEPGNFYAFGRAISKERILVKVGSVSTSHQEAGGSKKSYEPPPPPEKIRALLPKFKDLPREVDAKLKTEADLREEIKSLRGQLVMVKRPAPPPPPPTAQKPSEHDLKVVEVPIMGKREVAKLEKLVERMEKAKSHLGFTTQSLEIATRDIQATIDRMKDGKSTNEIRKLHGLAPIVKEYIKRIAAPKAERHSLHGVFGSPPAGAEPLTKCERAILTVLAQHDEPCPLNKIALLACYTKTSGSFINSLSALRTRGYLQGSNAEPMSITQAGREALGDFEPLPAGADLVRFWMSNRALGGPERKILTAVVDRPEGLTLQEIAEATGYTPSSGSFINSLSSLRTAGVLVGRNSERMRAADALLV